ncbi:hypothetical protein AB0D04_34970 [Streptomyces sp. NPDC048483]|uniref:hypothetical protein n=1 Tax=Streptomyces sp. NPDC048483 TaxID=3154927 RepID=UPI00343D2173
MPGGDDAFTLLRYAADLLPESARAENGVTVDDVRDYQRRQEWELVLALLMEIGDGHPVPVDFWCHLAEAARQMMLERSARWCVWRGEKLRHGTFRARLTLLRTQEGGRRTALPGEGQLRPLWHIGSRTPDGAPGLNIAQLWVEGVPEPAPGESATIRVAPLSPGQWRHLEPGDVITMHEGRPLWARPP